MPHISLRQLKAFVAVAEAKNFNRAAENLYLSSSTVSNLIADLETRIEFPLFIRTTRKVTLSEKGKEFLPYATSILRQLRIAEAASIELRDRNIKIVRVAAPQVVAATLLPEIIAAYAAVNPDVRIHIVDSPVISLSDQVVNGVADIAIGPEQPVSEGISVSALFESNWVLWCHPEHPLASKQQVKWSELSPYFISAAGSDHEKSLASVINSLPPKDRFNVSDIVDSVTTALGLVSENLAIAMTPEFVEKLGIHPHLKKLDLIDPYLSRRYVLYGQGDLWVSEPVKEFTEYTQAFLENYQL
ncbi:MAG: LysR family transcriptional regulator [Gammaproteobacteria bacterium]|nr:LysR family transcriptional regulator [Gammaproteobacteria bacterium]